MRFAFRPRAVLGDHFTMKEVRSGLPAMAACLLSSASRERNYRAPAFITWAPTTGCESKCRHCAMEPSEVLPLRTNRRIAHAIGQSGAWGVSLVGGEPLLVPGIFEFARLLSRRYRKRVSLGTNGARMQETLHDLERADLAALHISMDSHRPELHDHLRNQPGLFRSVERSIRSLLESRQRAGRSTPRIIVRCTVSRANFREMEAFASYWSERVDGILFQAVQHNALHSVRDRDLLFGPQDEPAFRRAVVALQRAHPFCRNRYHDLMPDYLFRPEALSRRLGLRCLLMSSVALTVLPDGRVVICYGSEDSVVGRLPDRSVHSIWTDPRTKAAQAALRQPHCGDYCWETHTPFNLFLVGLDRIWPF